MSLELQKEYTWGNDYENEIKLLEVITSELFENSFNVLSKYSKEELQSFISNFKAIGFTGYGIADSILVAIVDLFANKNNQLDITK